MYSITFRIADSTKTHSSGDSFFVVGVCSKFLVVKPQKVLKQKVGDGAWSIEGNDDLNAKLAAAKKNLYIPMPT